MVNGKGARQSATVGEEEVELTMELSRRLRSSDRRAFSELFELMHPRLLRYSWSFVHSEETARDVVQDVFLKLWQVRETINPERSLKALLYTMVRNLSLNKLRGAHNDTSPLPELGLVDTAPAIDDVLDAGILRAEISRCIDKLPYRRREAFVLSRFEGLTHAEIASVMNLTPRTVSTHIVLALRDLRKSLSALQYVPSDKNPND